MNMFGALMMTVTMTMTGVMLPRIYMSWMTAKQLSADGEVGQMERLLAEQNAWVLRQLGCGAAAISLICMVRTSRYDLGVPASMEVALALYASISLAFAVLESLIAQKAADFLDLVPVAAPVREEAD